MIHFHGPDCEEKMISRNISNWKISDRNVTGDIVPSRDGTKSFAAMH